MKSIRDSPVVLVLKPEVRWCHLPTSQFPWGEGAVGEAKKVDGPERHGMPVWRDGRNSRVLLIKVFEFSRNLWQFNGLGKAG